MSLEQARIIRLPKSTDGGASLTFLEGKNHIPFEIKRVYYLYDIKSQMRGGHAHKEHQEFLIPICGSFDVVLDDGFNKKTFELNSPAMGLYYPTMIWHEVTNFSPNSQVLVMASEHYDHEDYFRSIENFYSAVTSNQ
ncbi:MAG: FdtA/QdtA family cupin domain-containing protein [Verrucomicrobiota bacterium]|nr:FdtA/QdtA family cupin domain-containing protein [Verrucomicrobiota bacterium]